MKKEGLQMERIIVWSVVPLLMLGIIGCGDDEPTGPQVQEIVKGLSGDTYMNTRFGVKIMDLPVEEWTVKALGSDEQGLLESGQGYATPMYHLLLMEPVPEDEFVNLSVTESVGPVLEAGIPFVWVGLDYWEGGSFETYNLTENLESYAALHGAVIESKKFVSIGNATAIQAVLLRSFGKEALTWFAKDEIMVRCEYIAEESEFDKYYVGGYIRVVENVWLMGN